MAWNPHQFWRRFFNLITMVIPKNQRTSSDKQYQGSQKKRYQIPFYRNNVLVPVLSLIPLVLSWNLLIPWFQNFQKTWTRRLLTKVNTRPTLVHCATTSMVGWRWPKVSFFLTMLVKMLVLFFPTLYLTNRKNN